MRARSFLAVVLLSLSSTAPLSAYVTGAALPKTERIAVATEMRAKNGAFNGYVEPVFDKIAIFDPSHDADNPISFIWQGILEGITRIIRNHPKDRFGTKVPLTGSFDDPDAAILETVFNVFRNAFVKAFEGKLSNENIDLPKVDPDKE